MSKRFNLGLFPRRQGGNHKIADVTVNLGSTKGRGSSTRMFNYCKQTNPQPWNCINQFINVSQSTPTPTPTPTCDYTFTGTGELTSVTVNNEIGTAQNICIVGYTSIGNYAFNSKTQITSVTIGNTVTSIGNYAFQYSGLTSVTIPDSVISIGSFAFYGCTELTSINVDPDNANYSSIEGVLFNEAQTTLIQYPVGKSELFYTIPNSVTSIGGGAFYNCTSLESVIIPDSVEIIGAGAFESCTHLESITLTQTSELIIIDSGAFRGSGLLSVTIPNSVTSIGSYAFFECRNLISLTINNSVLIINQNAFKDCFDLETVTLGNSVTIIDQYAFYDCFSLLSITIPDSVQTIGLNAFGLSGLATVTISSSKASFLGNQLGYTWTSPGTVVTPDFYGASNNVDFILPPP